MLDMRGAAVTPVSVAEVDDMFDIGSAARTAFVASWDASGAGVKGRGYRFLDEHRLRESSRAFALRSEIEESAVQCARTIRGERVVRAFTWYCAWLLRRADADLRERSLKRLPSIEELRPALGEAAETYYLVVLLSAAPELLARMRRIHDRRAIPRSVADQTLADVETEMGDYRKNHGRWGMEPHLLSWFSLHLGGRLYRIERFNFELGRFRLDAAAFRHRSQGLLLLLAEDGTAFDSRGQLVGASDAARSETGVWRARLEQNRGSFVGNPIWPSGRADPQRVVLERKDWTRVLKKGDSVVHLHIPSGGRLDFEPIGDNLHRALAFLRRHFPRCRFKAIDCVSWFLDGQLREVLDEHSNIIRFQDEVYLVPSLSSSKELIGAVFGPAVSEARADDKKSRRDAAPRVSLPTDTSLQRGIAHLLDAGEPLGVIGGGCLLMPEDLRWGEHVYRDQDFRSVGLEARRRT